MDVVSSLKLHFCSAGGCLSGADEGLTSFPMFKSEKEAWGDSAKAEEQALHVGALGLIPDTARSQGY